jgi:hypothetical protein
MTSCDNENNKRFIMNVINDSVFPNPNAPALSAGKFFNSFRSRVVREAPYRSYDSVLVWLCYFGQLSLSSSLNKQLVFQSGIPCRISDTACSKGIASEGWLFASSYARISSSSSSCWTICCHSRIDITTAFRLPSSSTKYSSCSSIMLTPDA